MKLTKTTRRAALGVVGISSVAVAAAMLGSSPAHAEGTVLGLGHEEAVSGSYIAILNSDTDTAALADEYGVEITSEYDSVDGIAFSSSADEAKALAADAGVKLVQANMEVSVAGTQEDVPSWGIDRVDQTEVEGDTTYTYPDSAGEGVTAYIIDTGIDMTHEDFGGRATSGTDTVDGDDDATDGQGHGTHVAGTVAGETFGLAKSANLVAVRVLDDNGSGTLEGVIAGIDWVTANHEGPSVANMSLGAPQVDETLNAAVAAMVESGVTTALAAGNDSSDACGGSPASTPEGITVAASDNADNQADFSNFGECVDIYAPGVDITSAAMGGGEATFSGTSMAAPHVAGAAALYLGENLEATPEEVGTALTDNALADVIQNPSEGTPNLLLNIEFLNGGGEDPEE